MSGSFSFSSAAARASWPARGCWLPQRVGPRPASRLSVHPPPDCRPEPVARRRPALTALSPQEPGLCSVTGHPDQVGGGAQGGLCPPGSPSGQLGTGTEGIPGINSSGYSAATSGILFTEPSRPKQNEKMPGLTGRPVPRGLPCGLVVSCPASNRRALAARGHCSTPAAEPGGGLVRL